MSRADLAALVDDIHIALDALTGAETTSDPALVKTYIGVASEALREALNLALTAGADPEAGGRP